MAQVLFIDLSVGVARSYVEDGLAGARQWPPPPDSPYERFLDAGIDRLLDSLEETTEWWKREQAQVCEPGTHHWNDFAKYLSDLAHLLAQRDELRLLRLSTLHIHFAIVTWGLDAFLPHTLPYRTKQSPWSWITPTL